MYDFSEDTMTYNGVTYQLQPYREWLVYNHEQLCTGHFIKAIRSGGKTLFTYDWQSIYLKSQQYGFIDNFIREASATNPIQLEDTEQN